MRAHVWPGLCAHAKQLEDCVCLHLFQAYISRVWIDSRAELDMQFTRLLPIVNLLAGEVGLPPPRLRNDYVTGLHAYSILCWDCYIYNRICSII